MKEPLGRNVADEQQALEKGAGGYAQNARSGREAL